MLPSHERGVRAFVVAALADAGRPIPIERVVWGDQDAPTLERPYILLIPTADTRRGPAPERTSTGDHGSSVYNSRTDGTGSVSITVVGPVERLTLKDTARAYAAEIEPRLQLHELAGAANPLDAAKLGVEAVTLIPNANALTGSSQWETRATVDVTFTIATVVGQAPGTVSTVEVTGTTAPDGLQLGPKEISG